MALSRQSTAHHCMPTLPHRQVSELSATQRQLEQHVAAMFAAPAWRASPRQCELADRLKVGWGVALAALGCFVGCWGGWGVASVCWAGGCCIVGCFMHCRLPFPARHLQVLEAQAAEAARGAGTYGRGAQLLGESNQLLAEAVQGLQQTQVRKDA